MSSARCASVVGWARRGCSRVPGLQRSRLGGVEAAIKRRDKIKQARPDKREPEQADQDAPVSDMAQGGQHAADLMRFARIAVEGGGDQKAADQRDRGAAARDAVSRDRADQPLLLLRQRHLAIDIADDAPDQKSGPAAKN